LSSSCRSAWGASVPPHSLRVARSQSRGLASSSSCRRRRRVGVVDVSCRRVVAPVAPVTNCPSQGSTCASLQCSCKSQSLERLRVSDAGGSRRSYRNGRASAVAEGIAGITFPKGPPKSSVGGTPGWNLLPSARRYGWPPPGLYLSVLRDFRPGLSSTSRG
jgi:hypothetical protein